MGEAAAAAAIRAEIAYYRAHLHEGSDAAALVDLRARCAEAMRPALGDLDAPSDLLVDALLASLRFFAYPDSAPALRGVAAAGIRTVVVSNWDWSLHERLPRPASRSSSTARWRRPRSASAKPDGVIFRAALELVGAAAADAWHVGDTPEADVEGARAAGLRPVLIARDGPRATCPVCPCSDRWPSSYPWRCHDDELTRSPAAAWLRRWRRRLRRRARRSADLGAVRGDGRRARGHRHLLGRGPRLAARRSTRRSSFR